jgi:hypothetical protein
MGPQEESKVAEIWDTLRAHDSLSDWQALWLIYACRQLALLSKDSSRIDWVKIQKERGVGRLLHAESCLALADVGGVTFAELDQSLRLQPEALNPWYVLAMKDLRPNNPVLGQQIRAVRDTSPLYRLLLGSSQ